MSNVTSCPDILMRSWTTNEKVQARWLENSSFALAIEGTLQVLRVEVVKVSKKRR
jgi:hypothetical protein